MLSVRDITKSFGGLHAVRGVSFTLAKGEAFGLLGPNGAGKSTAINMIIGALTPDSGAIEIEGTGGPLSADGRCAIGVAPQTLSLYEELTAEENLAFFGKLYGLTGGALKERVAWSIDLAGLEERKRDRVSTYSGGMKRRLNIAVAMVHDPSLVILDEPTVGVDPQSRNYIFDAIERLKTEGRTVLYTTHYMEEAERLCDRIAIMDKGRILALDTLDGLIESHGGASVIRATSLDGGEIDGFERTETGGYMKTSDDPMGDLATLVSTGVAFESLTVQRPDLEAVFLALTGRTLRDGGA